MQTVFGRVTSKISQGQWENWQRLSRLPAEVTPSSPSSPAPLARVTRKFAFRVNGLYPGNFSIPISCICDGKILPIFYG